MREAGSRAGSAPSSCFALDRGPFVHGFAKNERDNIRDGELAAFKLLAARLLAYDDLALAKAVADGVLMEVRDDD